MSPSTAQTEWATYRKAAIGDFLRLNREAAVRQWELMDSLSRGCNAAVARSYTPSSDWLVSARREEMVAELRTEMTRFANQYSDYITPWMRKAAEISLNGQRAEALHLARLIDQAGLNGNGLRTLNLLAFQRVPVATVEALVNRISKGGLKLSSRIWQLGAGGLREIEDITTVAALEGKGVAWIARAVEERLNPAMRGPGWTSRGKPPARPLPGGGYVGMKGGPLEGRPYMWASAARLARTELSLASRDAAARGQTAMRAYLEPKGLNPFVGLRWNRSAAGAPCEICDENAEGSSPGLPDGVYAPEDVPESHACCLCTVTDELVSADEFVEMLGGADWQAGPGEEEALAEALAPEPMLAIKD